MSQKTKNLLYWFFTLWLSLGMASTGIVQLFKLPDEVEKISQLGYPTYFLTLLAVWKLLGVGAVLLPKFVLLKEWAYAGFFFAMSGAAFSHIACEHHITEVIPSVLLLSLTIISWYLRPMNRKIQS